MPFYLRVAFNILVSKQNDYAPSEVKIKEIYLHSMLYASFTQAAAMKNKFWMENLKAIIAGSVVGLLVLGLIYWKFFMPQPPPPGYGPPPGGAAAGGEGSTTQTRSHKKHSRKSRLSVVYLTKTIHITPHIQNQT